MAIFAGNMENRMFVGVFPGNICPGRLRSRRISLPHLPIYIAVRALPNISFQTPELLLPEKINKYFLASFVK